MSRDEIFSIVLKEIYIKYPDTKGIYIFGSFAKEEETEDSDLDIALLLKKPANKVILWDTAQDIALKIQREVDLVDLLSASTVFQFQIISSGKRIDSRDLKACDSFEDLIYSMYLRFNESRQEILDDIKERGRIY